VIQTVYAETTARTTISGIFPDDDTIPQITEGTEVLSLIITPSEASNKILLTAVSLLGHSDNFGVCSAIFRSGQNDALAAIGDPPGAGDNYNPGRTLVVLDSPASVSALTYSLRVGAGVPGTVLNGWFNYTNKWGQSIRTTLVAQEIKA
jgi:hypothetical protein